MDYQALVAEFERDKAALAEHRQRGEALSNAAAKCVAEMQRIMLTGSAPDKRVVEEVRLLNSPQE